MLANNGALPTTPASAPVMRSHRDGRWPLAPPSHDGLARAVAARPPLVRRRRRAAASHAASSRGRLSRCVVTRPPVTPRRRAATYSRAYVAQRLLAPSSYDRLLCAVVASAGNDLPVWRTVAHARAAGWAPPRACAVP